MDGYGRDTEGNCVAIDMSADAGGDADASDSGETDNIVQDDTGAQTDTQADTDTQGDTDTGGETTTVIYTVILSGHLAYRGGGTLSPTAVCFVALWDVDDLQDGYPHPDGRAMGQTTVACPSVPDVSVGYEAEVLITGATTVGAFAGMDLDGDGRTTNDFAAGAFARNPFDVEPDVFYTGIHIDTY